MIWIKTTIVFLFLFLALHAEDKKTIIMAAGDVNLAHWITPILQNQDLDYPFIHLKETIEKADIFITNLEAPFCNEGQAVEKSFVFKTPTDLAGTLNKGNINLVSLANNHIMDYGPGGLIQTMETLKKHNIAFSGAGLNRKNACKSSIHKINGNEIAYFAYSMTLPKNFWATDSSAGTAYPVMKTMIDSIKYYKNKNHYVIVSFHWGRELQITPEEYQFIYAHKAIDAGADLILGHHPHILQGIEVYKKKLIFYSLGNYIFASYSKNAAKSIIVKLHINNNSLDKAQILPLNVNNYEINFRPKLLKNNEKTALISHLNIVSRKFNKDFDIIDDYGFIETK